MASSRRQSNQLNMVHRILSGRTPSYLTDYFTKLEDVHSYDPRAGATTLKFDKYGT